MQSVTELAVPVKTARLQSAERNLGMTVYSNGMPLCVCGTPGMRDGWLLALNAEAAATTWTGDYRDVRPDYQRDDWIGE